MKQAIKTVAMTLGTVAIFGATGCNAIRDYSVQSYQGIVPARDTRNSVAIAASARNDAAQPFAPTQPSVPAQPPTAAPAAPPPTPPVAAPEAKPEPKPEEAPK